MKNRRKDVVVGSIMWFIYFELIIGGTLLFFNVDSKIFVLSQVVVIFMTAVIIAATFGNQNKDYEN